MFSSDQIKQGLFKLGLAAGDFVNLRTETKQAIGRLITRAALSGDADQYLGKRLAYLEAHEDDIDRPPPVRATSQPVEGQFVEEGSGPGARGSGRARR